MADSFTKKLRNFFGTGLYKKKNNLGSSLKDIEISPVKVDPESRKVTQAKFSSGAKKLWDWYVGQTYDSVSTLKNRMDRYEDLEFMLYNEPTISFALDLYADETAQSDENFKLIGVTSKNSKVTKAINDLLDKWSVDQPYIRECAYNLVLYGDSVDVIESTKEEGIKSFSPIDVKDLTDRLEFKLSEAKKVFSSKGKWNSTKSKSVSQFIKDMEDKEKDTINLKEMYGSYLFGFVLDEDVFVYPWQVNHYRLYSRKSEFWPFGRSLFINLIGPFRQLKTSLNLMALARAESFPKEIFEVSTTDSMSEIEKWEAVNSARQEYENLGINNKKNDEFSIGDQVWIPEGLINHKTVSSDIRPENINDIELLRDNLIIGTRIPKGYLIVDRGGWGTSSQSLLQQSKPFGRAVYSIQSVILKNLSHLIRLHFLMTDQFDKENTEFQLSLNYPVVEEASDRLRMKQDTVRLAGDIISGIKDSLGLRGEEIPPKVVKSIFSKFSFLSDEDVNLVVDELKKDSSSNSDKEEIQSEKLSEDIKRLKERLSEEIIYDSFMEAVKKNRMKEGILNGRHYYSSTSDFTPQDFKFVYESYKVLSDSENNKMED
jgi:hypothetical protein